ncbi:multiheme c-type cytochrome [Rubripirellula reticaptiva]|nr:multiheme c-type cytochrome [Rubripirellula reticaptiva]
MASTPLAKTLAKQASYDDSRRQQRFQFTLQNDDFQISTGNRVINVNWLMGSGKHAQTPIATDSAGHQGVEIRLSAFGNPQQLELTPDHDRFDLFDTSSVECFGRPMDSSDLRSCLGCHSTVIPPSALPLHSATMITNVGCERCHGPRQSHVISAREGRAADVKPMVDFETAQGYMQVCSSCHRDERSVRADSPEKDHVRFQPYGLQRSRCYLESEGAMTCSSCHDPHDATSTDRQAYIARCQSCHSATRLATCPSPRRGDCIACHMPKVEWTAGIAFHDHHIQIPAAAGKSLVERYSTDITGRANKDGANEYSVTEIAASQVQP